MCCRRISIRGDLECDDLESVCQWVLRTMLSKVSKPRLYIIGFSSGAAIACSAINNPHILHLHGVGALSFPFGTIGITSLFNTRFALGGLRCRAPLFFSMGENDEWTSLGKFDRCTAAINAPKHVHIFLNCQLLYARVIGRMPRTSNI